jgi:hypothetical protein
MIHSEVMAQVTEKIMTRQRRMERIPRKSKSFESLLFKVSVVREMMKFHL